MTVAVVQRRMLLGTAGAAVVLRGRAARAALPTAASLLMPGPGDNAAARWGAGLAGAVGRDTILGLDVVGGPDGVTAANRFTAQAAPDGGTLLLAPGAALHAHLIGDVRAHFDPTGWLPVCATGTAVVVLGRGPLVRAAAPARFIAVGPAAPEAAALLALDLLGVVAQPVFGHSGPAAELAVRRGEADALVIGNLGVDLAIRSAALGLQPWFVLDPLSGGRLAALPEVPTLSELLANAPPAALEGCRAALAAVRLRAAVVLPSLTPADVVTQWRRATERWVEDSVRADPAMASRGMGATETATALLAATPSPEAVLTYRAWLDSRFGWRAG